VFSVFMLLAAGATLPVKQTSLTGNVQQGVPWHRRK